MATIDSALSATIERDEAARQHRRRPLDTGLSSKSKSESRQGLTRTKKDIAAQELRGTSEDLKRRLLESRKALEEKRALLSTTDSLIHKATMASKPNLWRRP